MSTGKPYCAQRRSGSADIDESSWLVPRAQRRHETLVSERKREDL